MIDRLAIAVLVNWVPTSMLLAALGIIAWWPALGIALVCMLLAIGMM